MTDVWHWAFTTPAALHQALEEYTMFLDGGGVQHYGHDGLRVAVDELGRDILDAQGQPLMVPDPDPPTDPEDRARLQMDKARIRSEIDACMELMRRKYPHLWYLLDRYFRRGLSAEPCGWLPLAVTLGYHKGKCPPQVRCPVVPGDGRRSLPECQRAHKNHCHWDHDSFERQVTYAVARLFDVHRIRSGRT